VETLLGTICSNIIHSCAQPQDPFIFFRNFTVCSLVPSSFVPRSQCPCFRNSSLIPRSHKIFKMQAVHFTSERLHLQNHLSFFYLYKHTRFYLSQKFLINIQTPRKNNPKEMDRTNISNFFPSHVKTCIQK
jgi:hypothetical protein